MIHFEANNPQLKSSFKATTNGSEKDKSTHCSLKFAESSLQEKHKLAGKTKWRESGRQTDRHYSLLAYHAPSRTYHVRQPSSGPFRAPPPARRPAIQPRPGKGVVRCLPWPCWPGSEGLPRTASYY